MKDLRSRWNVVVVLLVFGAILGSTTVAGAQVAPPRFAPLRASSFTMQFGSVAVGSSRVLSNYIFNRSRASVTITSATLSGADFQISLPAFPVTIGPRQRIQFVVSFAPHNAGASSDTIMISSTASQPSMTVSLFGNGTTPGTGGGTTPGQLTPSPSTLSFGNVAMGGSQSQPVSLTNSGGTTLLISQAASNTSDFVVSGLRTPVVLAPNQSLNFNVLFAPKATGNRSGSIAVSGSAALSRRSFRGRGTPQSASIAVSGVGGTTSGTTLGQLTSNPGSLSFGTSVTSTPQTKSFVATNSGTASVTINQAGITGAGYTLTAPVLPMTLTAGQTANFSVTFVPLTTAAGVGGVSIISTASNPTLSIPLAATVSSPGSLASSTPVAFGTLAVGTTQNKMATITNSGGSSVTISKAIVSGTGFSMPAMSMPTTLAPNQSTNINITCAPKTAGALSGNLTVTSNATNATLAVPLSVTAVASGALTVTPSSFSFGPVATNSTQSLPATLTNTGGSSVTVSQATFTGAGYSTTGLTLPVTLTAGQTASFSVVFAPKTAGTDNFNLSITSNASNATLTAPVSGTAAAPGALSATSPSLSFGSVTVGSTKTLPETLTNSGGSSITVAQATAGTGYTMSGLTLPVTLAAGQSTSFNVVFSPQSAVSSNLNLAVTTSNPASILTIPLSGVGAAVASGALTIAPSSFTFGSVATNSTQSLPATLTNTGGSSVTVSQATFTGAGYSTTGLTLPVTLAAGQTASFSVVFAPTSAGTDNFNLSVSSNASNATLTAPVTGTAAAAGALSAGTPSLSFGSVTVGSTKTMPETLTNSGGSSITVTQTAAGAGYSVSGLTLPMTLAAGKSTSFSVAFAPQSAVSSSVNLAVTTSNPASTVTIPLSGAGITSGTLGANAVSFGTVQVGNTGTQTATLKNSGGSSVTVSSATSSSSQFGMNGLSMPLTLTAGQSFTFNVTFTPTTSGAASGSIALASDASSSPSIALSGTGAAAGTLSVSPTSFGFGSVTVGTSKSLSATLKATGGSVTVNSAAISTGEFGLTGPSLPLSIASGGTASFTLTFNPQSSGAATANVSFGTSASSSPITEAVTGSGAAAAQPHSVELSWSPSSSAVTGYNVYRGSQSGGPYTKLNPTPDTTTSYTDTSVQAGQTYFYVTTAVASDGSESSFSNQVTAVIPTP